MGFYSDRILPRLIDLAMRNKQLRPYRERVIGAAEGRALEIGIGSGRNLLLYPQRVERVIGLDPSPQLLAMTREAARRASLSVALLEGSATAIPLDRASVDTVVSTWSMCSIPDAPCALEEILRVLKPTGRLLFAEHGRSPDAGVRWWQDHLTPIWKRIGGGCHLNRPIAELIGGAGFVMERLDRGYIRGRNPMTFTYEGSARPRRGVPRHARKAATLRTWRQPPAANGRENLHPGSHRSATGQRARGSSRRRSTHRSPHGQRTSRCAGPHRAPGWHRCGHPRRRTLAPA